MKKFFFIILIFSFNSQAFSSNKENIIQNLKDIRNIKFDFEQNINGKTEQGMCVIEYSLKINCKYNNTNKKILISNGKSLVIKNLIPYSPQKHLEHNLKPFYRQNLVN